MIPTGVVESKFSKLDLPSSMSNTIVLVGQIIFRMSVHDSLVRNQAVEHHHQKVCVLVRCTIMTHLIRGKFRTCRMPSNGQVGIPFDNKLDCILTISYRHWVNYLWMVQLGSEY
jgi:hypothetical protein